MRIRDLRNLGPASERMLKAAGITTPRQLDRAGAAEAYRRVRQAGGHPSLNLLWSLEGALLDLDWRELPDERRSALRAEVDVEGSGPGPVRLATDGDIPALVEVERRAGESFRTVGLAAVADDAPPSSAALRAFIEAGRAWVHDDGSGPVGYVLVEILDAKAHIEQVSVVPEAAGRGIGRGLIDHVASVTAAQGIGALTLTAFRDVPWNAPYYRRLGFEVIDEADIGPQLQAVSATEDRFGEPRVAMVRRLDGG